MKTRNNDWEVLAELCEATYGVQVDHEEKFFICCECGEPIYAEDWADHEALYEQRCPICNYVYANDFMEAGMMEEEAEWGSF